MCRPRPTTTSVVLVEAVRKDRTAADGSTRTGTTRYRVTSAMMSISEGDRSLGVRFVSSALRMAAFHVPVFHSLPCHVTFP